LAATLGVDDWQTDGAPVELKVTTATLDGQGQSAEVTVRIHRLKEPARVQRSSLSGASSWPGGATEPKKDLSDPNNWEPGAVAAEKSFVTDAEGKAVAQFKLAAGVYQANLETQDRFGKKVIARLPVRVLQPGVTRLALKIPHLLAAPDWSLEPGQEFTALWGTGYEAGRAFIEIEHRGKMIQRYWTRPGDTQAQIKQSVTEAMRGGFTLHVTQVRENRAYLDSRRIEVPWSNKNLDLKWEHFTSKLQPGQKETWTAVITPPVADKTTDLRPQLRAVAEMVATLYDESLDAFMRHSWLQRFGFFRRDYSSTQAGFENSVKSFQHLKGYWRQSYETVQLRYREFPQDLVANVWAYGFPRAARGNGTLAEEANGLGVNAALAAAPPGSEAPMKLGARLDLFVDRRSGEDTAGRKDAGVREPAANAKGPDLTRQNDAAPRTHRQNTDMRGPGREVGRDLRRDSHPPDYEPGKLVSINERWERGNAA
jgi:hypothetical protein